MVMKKKLLILLLAFAAMQLGAQDLAHYKRIVRELSSSRYQGRGYARGGANKAGKYLQREFERAGVDEVVCQPFTIDINTFCGSMKLWADGKRLTTACNALDVECNVTSPHPDRTAAPAASTAAPGIVWHPATTSRCP